MFQCSGGTRIKLKRNSLTQDNKPESNKRRWTGSKRVCAVNPPADGGSLLSSPEPAAADPGTVSSRMSVVSGAEAEAPPASRNTFSEHKREFFCRLRLALCFARNKSQKGGKRVTDGPTNAHALSVLNSAVSVMSSNVSVEPVELTPAAVPPLKHATHSALRERARPRGQLSSVAKTAIRTEVRRTSASVTGRRANISSKVELRRRLRSEERSRKRSVKNACCALCGDVKYAPPPSKNLARLLTRRSRAGDPSLRAGQKGACHTSESCQTSATAVTRLKKYPMVKLCDVAQVFGIATHEFSFVLPAVKRKARKRKRAQCLQKEFDFLMHPHPHCLRKHRHRIANPSWEVSTPTHSCASFSSGDPPSGATGSAHVTDTAETPDGSVKEWDVCLVKDPDCERMRQTDVDGTSSIPPPCEDCSPVECFSEKERPCPLKDTSKSLSCPQPRVPPLVLRRLPVHGIGFRSEDDSENSSSSPDEDEEDRKNKDSDPDMNSHESVSCQRTQAYIFFPKSSCARTCKPWPFPRTGPPQELRSSCTGGHWILTTPLLDTVQSSLSKCLSDKDIQTKLSEPTNQSGSSNEALEGLPLLSAPCENSVLERTPKSRVNTQNTMTLDVLKQQPSVLWKKPSTCMLQRSLNGSRVSLTPILDTAELESNQREKQTENATKRVNNYKLNGLGFEASLKVSGLLKNHSLLQKSGSRNHSAVPVIREEHENLPKSGKISICPMSALLVGDQEENKNAGRETLYNPGSLSEICLKVELPKSQQPSLVTAAVYQETESDALNSVTHSPVSRLAKQISDGQTITDSSSEDKKNEHVASGASCSSASSSDDNYDNGTCLIEGSTHSQPLGVKENFLDVSRAYAEDVLVLDVIQDDPELFGAVAETVSQKDTSVEVTENTQLDRELKPQIGNYCKITWEENADCSESFPSAVDVNMDHLNDGCSLAVKKSQSCRVQPAQSANTSEIATDWNNNQQMRETNSMYNITVINTRAPRLGTDSYFNGRKVTSKEMPALRTANTGYCRFYFSEHNPCLRSDCRFLHELRAGDEKFCMETVKRFCHAGRHDFLLRAVEVFMGYYSRCPPSMSFSQDTVNSLLSSLLDMGLLRKFEVVINLLLAHKRLPHPEIVVAVFKFVRERGLVNFVPQLILLTSKIVELGCVFSVGQCEVMQSHLHMMQVPRQQMDIFLAVKCRALVTNPHTSELSHLAQAVVRVEMLKHQEDWARLAQIFCSVCAESHTPGELIRFCCCVTMALLKEPKDKVTLPYELFAETVCQQDSSDEIKSTLARIGVSLIFRYHRTREWNKGVRLVNVMFRLQIEFILVKGLMGNEHQVSRCQLVTMAAELYLHSGIIEGALKLLRADGWFVSSSMWPCEPADIEGRKRVLTLLAGKTSHRDTFEILTNLPGLRYPIDGVQIKDYTDMFNAHLRLCLMKQTLLVAADILEFMLTQNLLPEKLQLQNLIHKLGKQNNWSRARALFKCARSAGFYSAVVSEGDSLFLPCGLSEIEMTLAFEMFIFFISTSLLSSAGSSQPLLITLRRQAEVEDVTESVYLAAGCRLLSAALIPNPKLSIRYTAVNQSQEQLFQLDRASAHKWLLQNSRWAQEVWAS